MRALVAIAGLILIVLVVVIGTGVLGSAPGDSDDEKLIEESVDIETLSGNGPGFDVEMGSVAPGEAEAEDEDEPPQEAAAPVDEGSPASAE